MNGGSIVDPQVASYLFNSAKDPKKSIKLKTSLAKRELEILKLDTSLKGSLPKKRRHAGYDIKYREHLLQLSWA